jgi:ATP-dependent protease ClpP protease subunit
MKVIVLNGVIGWDFFASDLRDQLPKGAETVRLDINSGGGDVFEAFEIFNALKEYKGKVIARVTGLAASAAADIFFGADEREWFEHSAVMYHRAWSLVLGNADDLKKQAAILEALDNLRIKDFCRVTGKDFEAAQAEFADETWLIGDEAMKGAGIVGRVVDGEETPDEPEGVSEAAARLRVQAAIETIKKAQETGPREGGEVIFKIAALLNKDLPGSAPDEQNFSGGSKVDFKEFIAQNPGAEAEILAFAETKIGPGAGEAKKAESERIMGLLALGGVQLSKTLEESIRGDETPEKFAVKALLQQQEIAAKGTGFTPGPVAQTPGEQSGVKPGETGEVKGMTEDQMKTYAKQRRGRA